MLSLGGLDLLQSLTSPQLFHSAPACGFEVAGETYIGAFARSQAASFATEKSSAA